MVQKLNIKSVHIFAICLLTENNNKLYFQEFF
jgi:hypothetical protein